MLNGRHSLLLKYMLWICIAKKKLQRVKVASILNVNSLFMLPNAKYHTWHAPCSPKGVPAAI